MNSTGIETSGLARLDGLSMPVYTSPGGEVLARSLAERTEKALDWLGSLAELPDIPPLFVVGPDDWDRVALVPQYGLAHTNRTRIVMGQEASGLWASVLGSVWPEIRRVDQERLKKVYGARLDLRAFTDLVIAHELTHLADLPGWLDAGSGRRNWSAEEPRLLWLTELFANLGLHGYVVEREPESLESLETLFRAVGGIPPAGWAYRRLDEAYASIATPGADGTNYFWFEFRLQILAKRLWEAAGAAGFRRINEMLHGPVLPDEEITDALAAMDAGVADEVRRWALGEGGRLKP